MLMITIEREREEVLEAIVNRTSQQEQELKNKKQELAELEKEKQEQNPNQKSWWPWIIGGLGLAIVIGLIAYFLLRNKTKEN